MDRGIVTNTNTSDMSTSTNIDTVTNVTVSIGAAPHSSRISKKVISGFAKLVLVTAQFFFYEHLSLPDNSETLNLITVINL